MAYDPGRKTLTVAPTGDALGSALRVHRLTIHERMPPFLVRRPASENPHWLCMHFHSEAVTGDATGSPCHHPAHALVIWPPGSDHLLGHPHLSWDHSWCFLSGALVDDLMRELGIDATTRLQLDDGALSERFFLDCHAEVLRPQPDPAIVVALLGIWLRSARRQAAQDQASMQREAHLLRVRAHIEAHLADDLSLGQLAAIAGLSPSRFSAAFKTCFGSSPGAFLVERRLAQAAMRLRRDREAIKEIAAACGFRDPFHFSRLFKRRYGCSPRAWRQNATADA